MLIIKSKFNLYFIIFSVLICSNGVFYILQQQNSSEEINYGSNYLENKSEGIPKLSFNGGNFSRYNISVIFYESTSSVSGNLTVNYYNNDPVNFTRIPFHLFLSGMLYNVRPGSIDILNVTTLSTPKISLSFEVNDTTQLLWVNLESTLEPYQRTSFEIQFYSVIPDGGFDRANSHGSNATQSRIYKFTSFYPMPCVYDAFDGWNTDPYLDVGDPFYQDMAYYNFTIEAPNGVVVAATGELTGQINKGTTIVYNFDPELPVREVTFAASRFYTVETRLISGVNISIYYIPKSSYIWANDAIDYATDGFDFFNDTFGFYPYSTLNIVEEYAAYLGMEYPAQVYVSEIIDTYSYPTSTKKWLLEKVIVHEIAHQWWYNLVGVDQVDWGFLDEGLTYWSTDYYAEIIHGDWEYFQYTIYYDRVRTYYSTDNLSSKINQSAYNIIEDNLDYGYISYYKSPLIFEKISRTLGQADFILGLKTFFEQFQFEIALLSDLQDILEVIAGYSLDWLFFPWFDNHYLPKYNFLSSNYDANQGILHLTINDLNEPINNYAYSQQVQLLIYDSGGIPIYNEWTWINGTTTLNIPLSTNSLELIVRLEYGDEVLVQLSPVSPTYIELYIHINGVIPGYDINILLIFCLLPIALISKIILKRKINSKI